MKKILVLLLFFINPVWAEITVSFEPSQVNLGESTELIIESNRSFQELPNISALIGPFAVGGQENDSVIHEVGGRKIRFYRLSYTLFPRQAGELTSAGVAIKDVLLPVAQLTVLDQQEKEDLPVFVNGKVNGERFYPNETFLYTLSLIDGVSMANGQMTSPSVENALVTLLDMDKVYRETYDNLPVLVTERTYAITPLNSGKVTISPVEVYGEVAQKTSFNMKQVRFQTDPISVEILEKPSGWKGWWLPSRQVALEAEDSFPEMIQLGDSLNREISLSAVGTIGEYLPALVQKENEQIKVYPSPEVRKTLQLTDGSVQALEILSVVIVPKKAGKIKIPEIQVPWFNTQTQQVEVARLPEKEIEVQGDVIEELPQTSLVVQEENKNKVKAVAGTEISDSTPKADQKPLKQVAQPTQESQNNQLQGKVPEEKNNMGIWIGGLIFALLLIGTSVFLMKKHRKKSYLLPQPKESAPKKPKKPLEDLYPF